MWDQIVRRWIDLFFWWLPGEQKAKEDAPRAPEQAPARPPEQPAARAPEPAPAAPAAPAASAPAPPTEPAKPPVADDLTVIKGIGPVVQEKLRSLGISTFKDLAVADPETVTEHLKGGQPISKERVRDWTAAARERADARG